MSLRVNKSQHVVVIVINIELHRMLIVGEKSVMSIGKISESTSEVEGVLDWGCVVHWSEEMVFQSQYDDLLQQLVSHQELFSGS